MLQQVTVSGSVGKQVFSNSARPTLENLILTPSAANATVKVIDGMTSTGEVVLFGRAPSAFGSKVFEMEHKFTRGMHVIVIGTAAVAYLDIE